jgi:hypothetical protein
MLKPYKISLNRIHDKVQITEGEESLLLTVEGDAARMVAALTEAQKALKALNNDSTDGEKQQAALTFAQSIFGNAQAAKLVEFYRGDALCVIDVCGRYFSERLAKLISKAQKK